MKKDIEIQVISNLLTNYHCKAAVRLLYVLKGQLEIEVVGGKIQVPQGSMEVININEPVAIRGSAENKLILIEFSEELCTRWYNDIVYRILNINGSVFYKKDLEPQKEAANLAELKNRLHRFLKVGIESRFCPSNALEEEGHELLSFLVQRFDDISHRLEELSILNTEQANRLINIDTYMMKNLSRKIALDELASLEYISTQYLASELKNKFNHTFSDIISYYRSVNAVKCLLNPAFSIGDAIAESGFSDDRYFYRAFQKNFDCSPKQFRVDNMKPMLRYTACDTETEIHNYLELLEQQQALGGVHFLIKDLRQISCGVYQTTAGDHTYFLTAGSTFEASMEVTVQVLHGQVKIAKEAAHLNITNIDNVGTAIITLH